MNIHISWWMLPLGMLILSLYFAFRKGEGAFYGPDFSKTFDGFVFLALALGAVCLVLGHYI